MSKVCSSFTLVTCPKESPGSKAPGTKPIASENASKTKLETAAVLLPSLRWELATTNRTPPRVIRATPFEALAHQRKVYKDQLGSISPLGDDDDDERLIDPSIVYAWPMSESNAAVHRRA
mgnify:CR=1 FL=1